MEVWFKGRGRESASTVTQLPVGCSGRDRGRLSCRIGLTDSNGRCLIGAPGTTQRPRRHADEALSLSRAAGVARRERSAAQPHAGLPRSRVANIRATGGAALSVYSSWMLYSRRPMGSRRRRAAQAGGGTSRWHRDAPEALDACRAGGAGPRDPAHVFTDPGRRSRCCAGRCPTTRQISRRSQPTAARGRRITRSTEPGNYPLRFPAAPRPIACAPCLGCRPNQIVFPVPIWHTPITWAGRRDNPGGLSALSPILAFRFQWNIAAADLALEYGSSPDACQTVL